MINIALNKTETFRNYITTTCREILCHYVAP